MKQNYIKAFNELQSMGCPVFVHCDAEDRFDIDGEADNSHQWVDYFGGDCDGWEFGVHPDIVEALSKHGLFAEWVNPAHLRVYGS